MKTDRQPVLDHEVRTTAPSQNFIHAISELLGTDPSDLLAEMGHYTLSSDECESHREAAVVSAALV
jgi:hypothetical protein